MALLPIHRYYMLNGTLEPVDTFVPSENEGGIYEVLRVVNGVPLFLDEHLERLYKSAEIAGRTISFCTEEISEILKMLIAKNDIELGNILISYKTNLKAFFIQHNYPSDSAYKNGVHCGILHAERQNPNAKVFQTSVRQQANTLIAESNFHEVLLVDKQGRITEGSRSNVFFIRGLEVITPKADRVLLGITRKKALQCANLLNFIVKEEDVKLEQLSNFDAVFITGTSPKILPVRKISEFEFSTENMVLRKLISKFSFQIEEYIKDTQL